MPHDKRTLDFYAAEAAAYATRSDSIGVSKALAEFIARLPPQATVLDLGCGTGRDTRALIDTGHTVTAIDGSPEMAREAEKRIGAPVRVWLFENLDYTQAFDGIWANASLLHVPRAGLPDVLARVYRALKPNGLLFASFKAGGQEGRDPLGRYYNYLNRGEVDALIGAAGAWTTLEISTGRGIGYDGEESKFVNCTAKKSA